MTHNNGEHLIGTFVKFLTPHNIREERVAGLVGQVTDIYGDNAAVVYSLPTKVGSREEYGVFIDISRLILVGSVNDTSFDHSHMAQAWEVARKEAVAAQPEREEEDPRRHFTYLERQARRWTAFLVSRGYSRFEIVRYGEVVGVVWTTSADIIALNGASFFDRPYTVNLTNPNGRTFQKGDKFIEAEVSDTI
jgi:hypothetical protein